MTRFVQQPCPRHPLTAGARAAACAIACAAAAPLPAKAQAEAQPQTVVITASNRAQPIADVQAAVHAPEALRAELEGWLHDHPAP